MAAAVTTEKQQPTLVIRPPSGFAGLGVGDLWRFRELLLFLTWRDIKIRYKQTVLGAAWALLQPFLTMIVFTVVINHIGKVHTPIPYPLFALSTLALWYYFSNSVNLTSASLVGSAALITKVYFPRISVVLSPILAGLVDFCLAFLLVAGAMVYYGFAPPVHALLVPLFVVLAGLMALGLGLVLSALNVKYRDIRYAVPFVLQLWLWATPVAYPGSAVPAKFKLLYTLNPMTGVVEGYRWALLGTGHIRVLHLAISIGTALVLLLGGALYFSRAERAFADVI
ncbi:MAG TPA: ABC transporter permease [Gaiellaceae bacterium]|jgi:lipopolysaccharide transport system permease protein|nr:ABC transporter permease [Gaiellaceae bacterium]